MTSQLCGRSGGGRLMAWHTEPLPTESRFGSSLSNPDLGVLASAGGAGGLEFSALRMQQAEASEPFTLQPIVTMERSPASPQYQSLRWQRRHLVDAVGSVYPYGLVTAGVENSCEVFNPKKILDGVDLSYRTKPVQGVLPARPDFGLVCRLAVDGPVSAVDADSVTEFRLAVGTETGVVQLYDMEQPQRSVLTMECGTGAITGLKWHPLTHNVLAGTTGAGQVHVLNPKSRKPLLTITDPKKRQRISGLCWLEAGKNLVVSFDEDSKSGAVQLWDLRHPQFPYREESATHQQGVVSLELCGSDPRFFVTGSREGRCVTWSMANNSIVPYSEVVIGECLDNFAVTQTGRLAAVAVHSSSDRTVVHSLDSNTLSSDVGGSCRLLPAWLSRSSGVDFGFAGKLAWFTENEDTGAAVAVGRVSADAEFAAVADELEPYLETQNFAGLCDAKAAQAGGDAYESDVWQFLKCAFLPASERREHTLRLLGFSPHAVANEVDAFLGHRGGAGLTKEPQGAPSMGPAPPAVESPKFNAAPNPQDTDTFFDQLANNTDDLPPAAAKQADAVSARQTDTSKGYFVPTGSWLQAPLSLLRQAFLSGSPLAACEVATRLGRWPEAFLLAVSLQRPEIVAAVSAAYAAQTKDPFVATLVHSVGADYVEVVRGCQLELWKEAAAVFVTFVSESDPAAFEELARLLAKRLDREAGDQRSALLVYLLAGQFGEALNVLAQMPSSNTRPAARALKLLMVRAAAPGTQLSPSALHILSLFVDRLISNGRVRLASSVVALLETGADAGAAAFALLKFKVAEASGASDSLPFDAYDMQPAPTPFADHPTPALSYDNSYGSALTAARPPSAPFAAPQPTFHPNPGPQYAPQAAYQPFGASGFGGPSSFQASPPVTNPTAFRAPGGSPTVRAPSYSTHPAAGVGQLSSGLPTPWPIPTDAQQKRSGMAPPVPPAGAPCAPGDIHRIHAALMQLINLHTRSGEDPKKLEEHRLRFNELTQQLEAGHLGKETQTKLLDLSNAVNKMDWITASKCQQDLTQIAWSKSNKNWIMALKRLSAGPAMRPAVY